MNQPLELNSMLVVRRPQPVPQFSTCGLSDCTRINILRGLLLGWNAQSIVDREFVGITSIQRVQQKLFGCTTPTPIGQFGWRERQLPTAKKPVIFAYNVCGGLMFGKVVTRPATSPLLC